jgi:hypothetical protein
MQTGLAASTIYPVLFWFGDFASGAVRVCTHNRDVSWNGYTWTGLGDFIGLGQLVENGDVRDDGMEFYLNGVSNTLLVKALEAGFRRRECSLWLGLFTNTNMTALVADPIEWDFLMDGMPIADDAPGSSRITVKAQSWLSDLARPRERRLTDDDQQQLYPGDTGLEYTVALANAQVTVGGAQAGGAGAASTAQGTAPTAAARATQALR